MLELTQKEKEARFLDTSRETNKLYSDMSLVELKAERSAVRVIGCNTPEYLTRMNNIILRINNYVQKAK